MNVKLGKYHCCENSFLITTYNEGIDYNELAFKLCSKDMYDVDGLLILKIDPIEVLFFNKDGSEANMCGNGLNCLVHYCYDKYKIYRYIKFKTKAGEFFCEMIKKAPFYSSVNLGIGDYYKNILKQIVMLNKKEYEVSIFKLGVLHAVIIVDDLEELDGKEIFENKFFNKEANINFVKILNNKTFEMVTYEKGVGYTKACGTGAGACSYILHEYYGLDSQLDVLTKGGVLQVEISDNVYLTAESAFIENVEVSL